MLRKVLLLSFCLVAALGALGLAGAIAAQGPGDGVALSSTVMLNPGIGVVLGVGAVCGISAYVLFAARGAFRPINASPVESSST